MLKVMEYNKSREHVTGDAVLSVAQITKLVKQLLLQENVTTPAVSCNIL